MKSIEEIKDELAAKAGFRNWYFAPKLIRANLVDECMQEYAKQVAEAQREACGRCEALNKREDYKGVHSLAVLKTRLVTDNI